MTTLEKVADVAALIILIMTPIMLIAVFWMVHILPEKIAHKKNHPQKEAIKILVYMSLLFGGLLWPIAWVWTFLKSPRLKITRDEVSMTTVDGKETTLEETTTVERVSDDAPSDEPAPVHTPVPTAWREEIASLNQRLDTMRSVAEEYEQARSALAHLQEKAAQGKPASTHSKKD